MQALLSKSLVPLLSLWARQKSHIARTLVCLGTYYPHEGTPQICEAGLEHPSKNCVGHFEAGKELCAGLVCGVCWYLDIDWGWYSILKGPSVSICWDFLQLPKHFRLGRMRNRFMFLLGFEKKKPTRTVIPVCVLIMFTVMLLHTHAA